METFGKEYKLDHTSHWSTPPFAKRDSKRTEKENGGSVTFHILLRSVTLYPIDGGYALTIMTHSHSLHLLPQSNSQTKSG